MNHENNKVERRHINRSAPSLGQKIADCLSNAKAFSADIEMLTREVESELPVAEQAVEQKRQLALDPLSDQEEALQAVQLAELSLQRLQHALPLLQEEHRRALDQEYRERWASRHFKTQPQRDAGSENFARLRELQAEMLAILQQTAEIDKLVDEANSGAPANEPRRILSVELHARGLENYTRDNRSIMKETVLIGFDGQQLWPPKQPSMASVFAAPMDGRRFDGDCSDRWWEKGRREREEQEVRDAEELKRLEREKQEFYGLNGKRI